MAGTLIICATPIGNLGDISARLVTTLQSVDVVYAEDTRRTAKLLRHLGISVPMRSFFAGNERVRLDELTSDLSAGATVALVSDAGMPVVSDPGASAVSAAIAAGASVTAVPGPSAVTMAVAISGFDGDRFVFHGFIPRKGTERREAIAELRTEQRTSVIFMAPSRVAKDLSDLVTALGGERRIVIARELTKLHEEVWRGTLIAARDEYSDAGRRRGEFTAVLAGAEPPVASIDDAVDGALRDVADGATVSDAVRRAAETFGVSRREVYDRVTREKP
jgi:16S rRNA (cytidine1402-2'-O)-methyltransferase